MSEAPERIAPTTIEAEAAARWEPGWLEDRYCAGVYIREDPHTARVAELEAEHNALRAARQSYADALGCEVGDIHETIRGLLAERDRLREALLSADFPDICDATNGEHVVARQGSYKFCQECGETMTAKRIENARKGAIARVALAKGEGGE